MSEIDHVDTPFQKRKEEVFGRERSSWEKMKERLKSLARDLFVGWIPSDDIRQMPPRYMYLFGVILLFCLLAVFLSLLVDGIITNQNQIFLSPLVNSDQPSPNCDTIETSNTGAFLGTQGGVWQGQNGFVFSEGAFEITVTNFAISADDYALIMVNLYNILIYVGNITSYLDLGVNLLFWMSYTALPDPSNSVQRFYFAGDPLVVFDRQVIIGTLSSVDGVCNISSTGSFSTSDGQIAAKYQHDQYANNPLCNDSIGSALYFGYVPGGFNADTFTVNADIRTLITGISVNFNILYFDQLVQIAGGGTYTYGNITYNTSGFYNPKFAGMSPLTCIQIGKQSQCVVRVSPYMYALPIFSHLGSSAVLPRPCRCAELSEADKSNAYSPCNTFNFLVGFLFWPTDSPDKIFELSLKYQGDLVKLNEAAFNAMFLSSYWGQTSPYANELNSEAARKEAFEFCNINGSYCRIMTFSVFDSTPYTWPISEYYYQLQFGACQDQFSVPRATWQKLIDTPFAPLVQSYQKCRDSASSVFVSQIGIQVGNLSFLTPLCILFVLGLVVGYQRLANVDIPKAYTASEKAAALDALAISLLLARDRRHCAQLLSSSASSSVSAAAGSTLRNRNRKAPLSSAALSALEGGAYDPEDTEGVNRSRSISISSTSTANSTALHPNALPPTPTQPSDDASPASDAQQLLWALAAALESDATLHGDVYRLAQEVHRRRKQQEQHAALPKLPTKRKRAQQQQQRTISTASNASNASHASSASAGSHNSHSRKLLQRLGVIAKTSTAAADSGSVPSPIHPNGDLDPQREEGDEQGVELRSVSMSHHPSQVAGAEGNGSPGIPRAPVRILNDSSAPSSAASASAESAEMALVAIQALTQRLAAVHQSMQDTQSLSASAQTQQIYWGLVAEIGQRVVDLPLFSVDPTGAADAADANRSDEADGTVHAVFGGVDARVASALTQLLTVHVACAFDLARVDQVSRSVQAQAVGYRVHRGRVVVTLQQLQQMCSGR